MSHANNEAALNDALDAAIGGWATPEEAKGTRHEEELDAAYASAREEVAEVVRSLVGLGNPQFFAGAIALLDACACVAGREDDFWRVPEAVDRLAELKGAVYGFEAFGAGEDDDDED